MRPVSVVIPTYNKWLALVKVLEALLPQLKKQDEAIVVDDGSDDGTQEGIKEYGRIRYIRQEREGWRRATACNRGICAARNDCIILLDADCLPCFYLVEVYRRCFDPDLLLGGRIDRLHPDGRVEMDLTRLGSIGWTYWHTWGGNMCFSRRRALEAGLHDEAFNGVWGAADTDFSMRMDLIGVKPVFACQALTWHLEHPHTGREEAREKGLPNRELWQKREKQFKNPIVFQAYLAERRDHIREEYGVE